LGGKNPKTYPLRELVYPSIRSIVVITEREIKFELMIMKGIAGLKIVKDF
jgi:hypothetical protein